MQYKQNKPQVIYEVFADEIVLINLDSGNYYSLDSTAADIWTCIVQGDEAEDIVETLAGKYQGKRNEVETGVHQFLAELGREGLIHAVEADPNEKTVVKNSKKNKAPVLPRPVFSAPILHRYSDMQDLLLLDPIHEVDESGWPGSKPETSKRTG